MVAALLSFITNRFYVEKTIQEKRENLIQRHKELFSNTTPEERRAAYERVTKTFKDASPIDFEQAKLEGILKK